MNVNITLTDHIDLNNLIMGGTLQNEWEFRVALRDLIQFYNLAIEVAFNWKALYEDMGFLVMLSKWENEYLHISKQDSDAIDRIMFGGVCFCLTNSIHDLVDSEWRPESDYGLDLEAKWHEQRGEKWDELDEKLGRNLVDIINAYL